MEQLRNLGQTCRQHYEKLILTAALLILAGAVYFLYSASVAEREKIREIPKGFEGRKTKPVQSASLAEFNIAIKQVESPVPIVFGKGHHLFNPVLWESRAGGVPQKIQSPDKVGPGAMTVTRIEPFHQWVVFGYANTSGAGEDVTVNGYTLYTTNEFFPRGHAKRLARSYLSGIGTNNSPPAAAFFLREIKGEAKEPTELLGEMKDDGEKFSFAPGKPFSRIVGYEADMLYGPSGRKYTNVRKGAPIDIDGQSYKIVDILPNQVVLSDDSNGKQYSITGVQR